MAKRERSPRRTFRRSDIKTPADTGETIRDLEARLAAEGQPEGAKGARQITLKRDTIKVAQKAFQWRRPTSNMIPRDDVIFDMAKALREGRQLPPIEVFTIGGEHYVIDGHHRLSAYDTAGKVDVRATVFRGTLEEAERQALRANSRDKTPMSRGDKLEAAWRLVRQDKARDSIASIAEDASISESTVSNMRQARRTLLEQGVSREDLGDMSWNAARRRAQGQDGADEQGVDEWREAEARKLVEALVRNKLAGRLTKNPDITALALAMINDALPQALMAEWQEPPPFDPHDTSPDDTF